MKRLSEPQLMAVAELLKQNISAPEISALLHLTPGQTRTACTDAKAYMRGAALDVAVSWHHAIHHAADKGDHKPARDWLAATKVIDPPYSQPAQASTGTNGVTVQIGFALPGLPQPTVVQALPAAAPAPADD